MQIQGRRGWWPLLSMAAVAALVLACFVSRTGALVQATAPAEAAVTAEPTSTLPARTTEPGPTPVAATLPPVHSWQGTDIEGDIHLDAAGNVIPDEDLHRLFDYLLSASNELRPAQIRQYLLAVGHQHALGAGALKQLDGLYSRYNAYRRAAADLSVDATTLDGMQQAFDARHRLRQQMLGPQMADGFFGDSEAQDRYQLAVLAVVNNKSIDKDERERELAALRDSAPADVRAARQPSQTLQTLETQTEALRKAGADDSQIQALRVQTVGPEAAARLQTLDEQNAEWNLRMQALRQTRAQILADNGIAQADKQSAIDDYIAKNFSGPDAIRARALLSLDTASPD
jgi:lipase chaperone LimK